MMMADDMTSPAPEEAETAMPMAEAIDQMDGALCEGGIPGPVTIEPGEMVSVLARFDEPGETLIGCHQPGHWQAGMKGVITIVDAESRSPTSSPQA